MKRNSTTPELGDVQDRLGIVEEADAVRADRQAGGEVAEHRPEAGALEDRHRDHGRGEQRHDRHQVEPVRRNLGRLARHALSLSLPVAATLPDRHPAPTPRRCRDLCAGPPMRAGISRRGL